MPSAEPMTRALPDAANALVVVDMQRDFMPGGSLPVPRANEILPAINHYVADFENHHAPIYFARDWHPPEHQSFLVYGGRWPPHCVQGTQGAEFARELRVPADAVIVSKGTEAAHEAYSALEGTALGHLLRQRGVEHLWVAGVATEFCVRATVLDALRAGFAVTVLIDAIKPIDAQPGDGDRVVEELLAAGANVHSWAGHRSALHAA